MFFVGWYWYPKMGHQYHFRGGMVAENGRAFAKVTHTHPRSRALQGILLCARSRFRGLTHTHPRYKPFHGISMCVTLATVQRNAVEEKGRWISGGRVPKGERWRGKARGRGSGGKARGRGGGVELAGIPARDTRVGLLGRSSSATYLRMPASTRWTNRSTLCINLERILAWQLSD